MNITAKAIEVAIMPDDYVIAQPIIMPGVKVMFELPCITLEQLCTAFDNPATQIELERFLYEAINGQNNKSVTEETETNDSSLH